jgi:septal ring factor EnvC (AmiA/AmiB activator)
MLRQAAEEMERIVARLEQQRQAREAQPERPELPSVFASLKGHLIPPIEGKVVTPFGTSVDPITNLKSFSPGLIIQTRPGREVRAAATGIVAYVGELRGYGNFVIIDHGDQYYTTYAGLDKVEAVKGKLISAGKAVAVADSEGRVRFELRRGREPLDPIDWITSGAY